MKKHTYEQPLAETFELQLSASVLNNVSDGYNQQGGGGSYSGDGDTNDNGGY